MRLGDGMARIFQSATSAAPHAHQNHATRSAPRAQNASASMDVSLLRPSKDSLRGEIRLCRGPHDGAAAGAIQRRKKVNVATPYCKTLLIQNRSGPDEGMRHRRRSSSATLG